mgnify:CR=1 FL=1
MFNKRKNKCEDTFRPLMPREVASSDGCGLVRNEVTLYSLEEQRLPL